MSNKTQLQQNNTDLQTVLEQAQNLEGHGKFVWKKLNNDTKALLGYVLSNGETAYPDGGVKDGCYYERDSGKYVWEKTGKEVHTVTNPSFKVIEDTYDRFQLKLESDTFDLNNVDSDFFIGFSCSRAGYSFNVARKTGSFATEYPLELNTFINNGYTSYPAKYNPSTRQFLLKENFVAGRFTTGDVATYDGIKTYTSPVNCGYVLSDDPNKYPADGEQDGKYYKKVMTAVGGMIVNEFDSSDNFTDVSFIFRGTIPKMFGEELSLSLSTCRKILIDGKSIENSVFSNVFMQFGGKIKVNVQSAGVDNFLNLSKQSQPSKVWISKKCTNITASEYGLFYFANVNCKVYCEVASKPSGWSTYWNNYSSSGKLTTIWGVTEEQFDAMA